MGYCYGLQLEDTVRMFFFFEVAGKIIYDRHSYRGSCFYHEIVDNLCVQAVIFFLCSASNVHVFLFQRQ
jgi:hypothetical protein